MGAQRVRERVTRAWSESIERKQKVPIAQGRQGIRNDIGKPFPDCELLAALRPSRHVPIELTFRTRGAS